MGASSKSRCTRGVLGRAVSAGAKPLSLLICMALGASTSRATVYSWTGTGGTSWGTNTSWSPTGTPGTGDTASFTNTDAASVPGSVTSLLNVSRTITGLTFNNTASHYHTLDLNTDTLTDTGELDFNVDQSASTTTTIRDGTLTVNGTYANVRAGNAVSGTSTVVVDLSGLTAFNVVTAANFYVGVSSANAATGTLTLSPSNNINTQLVQVGAASSTIPPISSSATYSTIPVTPTPRGRLISAGSAPSMPTSIRFRSAPPPPRAARRRGP